MSGLPVITRWGMVTPLGQSAQGTWRRLLAGEFAVDQGRVALEFGTTGRAAGLASLAASQVAQRWSPQRRADSQTALVVGTSKGPVDQWLACGRFESSGLSQIADAVAGLIGIGGPRLTCSTACASGLHALIRAALLIQSGDARRVLVVAAESSLHPIFEASFRRLGVLSSPGEGCRPFDRNRQGFFISEGAAAVCLEADGAERNGILLERWSMGADATHLTGVDPDAVTLRRVLRQVIENQPIDLVHAHATGTQLNDQIELAAIEHALPPCDSPPVLYSHKGALGHSLGAAGLISVVINCMCHRDGVVPPNMQTKDPLPTSRVLLEPRPVARPIHRSIAIASGFGGAVAAVRLGTYNR